MFSVVWGGQLISLAGSSAAAFALAMTVYTATASAFALAMVTAATTVSSIYLAPLAGAISDRFGRRPVLIVGNSLSGITAAVLAVVAAYDSNSSIRIALIIGLVFIAGALGALLSVTMAATVRLLRSEADLTRVNGVTSLIESMPTLTGPVLGAAVYNIAAPAVVFAIDAVTFLLQAGILLVVRWTDTEAERRRGLSPFAGARSGLRFILADRSFRYLQFSFAGINLCNGLGVSVAVAFVVSASSQSAAPWNLAMFNTGGSVGLVLGSLLVIAVGARMDRRVLICVAILVGAALGRIGLVLTTIPVVWLLSAVFRNCAVQAMNAPLTAIWQERVPDEMQATVFGARRLLGQGPYPIAVLVGGLLADHVFTSGAGRGSAVVLLITACGEIAIAFGLFVTPALRKLSPTAPTTGPAATEPVR